MALKRPYVAAFRGAAKKAIPYVRTGLRVAGAIRKGYKQYKSISTNDVSNATTVRFRDMGDRGSVNTNVFRKRKRRQYSRKQKRRYKRFRSKVRKIIRIKRPPCFLQEKCLTQIFTDTAVGVGGAGLSGGSQLIFGNAAQWGLNLGQANASGGVESSYINEMMSRYTADITGTAVTPNASDWTLAKHYIKRRYHKLTVCNRNTAGTDLIFDLYECVAAQDIADTNYANPAITWKTLDTQENKWSPATDMKMTTKGNEPTNCPNFGKYWKILKKHKVRIPGGQGQIANQYQTFKMYGAKGVWDGNKSINKWALKGKTKYWMMVFDPEQMFTRYVGGENVFSAAVNRVTTFYPMNEGNFNAACPPFTLETTLSSPLT